MKAGISKGKSERTLGELVEGNLQRNNSSLPVRRSVSGGAQIRIVLRQEGMKWKRMVGLEDRMSGSVRRCGREREFARERKTEVGRKVGR
jgi:hypothetical protein